MTYKIYQATEKDIDVFFPFFEKRIHTEFPEYTNNTREYFITEDYSKEHIRNGLVEKRFRLFLAVDNNKVIGYFLTTRPYGGVAFGNWIAVDKQYQGKGIGTALLQAWETLARTEGAHNLHLWTDKRNREFYTHQGFILVGNVPDNYFGADDFFLYKPLSKSDEKMYLKHYLAKRK